MIGFVDYLLVEVGGHVDADAVEIAVKVVGARVVEPLSLAEE